MEKKELIVFVSNFWKIPISEVSPELSFDSQNLKDFSSIRFYQFMAALESNFSIKITNLENFMEKE